MRANVRTGRPPFVVSFELRVRDLYTELLCEIYVPNYMYSSIHMMAHVA